MKRSLAAIALIVVSSCTSVPTKPAPGKTSEFKNVQVLGPMNRDQLIGTMKSFSRSLGVRCDHCHVVTATTPKMEFDFPSDAKEQKRVARVMIQMVMQINGPWMERVEKAEHAEAGAAREEDDQQVAVTCWTCHRGHQEPEPPPPPPAEGAAPQSH